MLIDHIEVTLAMSESSILETMAIVDTIGLSLEMDDGSIDFQLDMKDDKK